MCCGRYVVVAECKAEGGTWSPKIKVRGKNWYGMGGCESGGGAKGGRLQDIFMIMIF